MKSFIISALFFSVCASVAFGDGDTLSKDQCVKIQMAVHSDSAWIRSIAEFQRLDWQKRYPSYFQSQGGFPALMEKTENGAVPSLETLKMMSDVVPKSHFFSIPMKKKFLETFDIYVSDSLGIFMMNVYQAGESLARTADGSEPTASQIYQAIKAAH